MVELDFKALKLIPFLDEATSLKLNIDQTQRETMDAQIMQYLKASVSPSIRSRINDTKTAHEIMNKLKEFEGGEAQEYIKLHSRFVNLKFLPHYDPIRFVAEFEKCINEYSNRGTNFPEEYVTTIFLQKIEDIYDFTSPMFS